MRKQKDPTPSRRLKWLSGMNRWAIFNPERWPHRELVSRIAALGVIGIFLWLRISQFGHFPQTFQDARDFYAAFETDGGRPVYSARHIQLLWGIKMTVWLIETAIYLGYIAAYASRAKAVKIARGFMETAFPVVVAGIPILIAFMPYSLPRWAPFSSPRHFYFYAAITTLIVFGGVINLIGLLTLRRAFTIMSEARALIVQGIFRHVRHPLYTGHFIIFFGSLLLRLHPATLMLYLIFCIGQIMRARIEERKLLEAFPQYADYQRRTGMFFPKGQRQ